jgi:hypothetical protein
LDIRQISTGEIINPWDKEPAEDVQIVFNKAVRAWEDSDECRRLRSAIENAPLPTINNIVAFACSSMLGKDDRSRAATQHALILTMRDIIAKRQPGAQSQTQIKCFAQDPIYAKADVEVLGRSGITVLEDPRAFLEVDDQSLVISFYPNIPVRQIVTDIARPAVMIWNRVESEAELDASWQATGEIYNPAFM